MEKVTFDYFHSVHCFLTEKLLPASALEAIVFTGSAVLNYLGLIDRLPKDLDVILIGGPELKAQVYKYLFNSEDPTRAADHHEQYDIIERYGVLDWEGKKMEIFVQSPDRSYITISDSYCGHKFINISKINDIFNKKWQYNLEKTFVELRTIEIFLTKQKPQNEQPTTPPTEQPDEDFNIYDHL